MGHYRGFLSLESTVLYCMGCSLSSCFCDAEKPDDTTLLTAGDGFHWRFDLSRCARADNLVGHCAI
jgi:hypothetical protein